MNSIPWYALLGWAIASLVYLAVAVHVIVSTACDCVIDKIRKLLSLAEKDSSGKITRIK